MMMMMMVVTVVVVVVVVIIRCYPDKGNMGLKKVPPNSSSKNGSGTYQLYPTSTPILCTILFRVQTLFLFSNLQIPPILSMTIAIDT